MMRAPAHVLARPLPAGRSATRTRAFLAACVYRRWGWIPIPVGGEDGKEALVPWADLREDPPTMERLVEWWEKYPDAGVAVLTGGGIVVFDVDGPSAEAYLAQQGGIPEGAAVATTPSGRRHVFFEGTCRPRVRVGYKPVSRASVASWWCRPALGASGKCRPRVNWSPHPNGYTTWPHTQPRTSAVVTPVRW